MKIDTGLVVADPWIGMLLDGSKTWEMRSRNAKVRGWIALIRKGSGQVYGIARLVDVSGPLTTSEMAQSSDQHKIPASTYTVGEFSKHRFAWKMAEARRLTKPIPYTHKSGAVIWVKLDPSVSDAIEREQASRQAT